MKKVNIYEAKTRLSQLVAEAAAGRDVVMVVAQSLAEPLVLLTNDGVLAGYGEVVRVV